MLDQDRLHLDRIDIDAAGLVHLLDSSDELNVSVVTLEGDVAGSQPAVMPDCVGCGHLVALVAEKDERPAHVHLASLACPHWAAILIGDHELDARDGGPAGT